MKKQALLLVGSAHQPRSTSQSLGEYLLERLAKGGLDTETLFLHRALRSEETTEELLAAVDRADPVILAFPLYVDTLPYLVTRTLELLAAHRQDRDLPGGQRLLVIVNCGFPEAAHNAVALEICRRFARETGFTWAGGLALGGGGAINGRPLSQVQGLARNVIRALDMTAEALLRGEAAPPAAVALMERPMIPAWLYIRIGHRLWKRQARKYGTSGRLMARPFVPS